MAKRWRIAPHDPARIAELEKSAGLPPVVAQLLVARGIDDPEEAKAFLDPKLTGLRDPQELPGVTQAAEQVSQAIAAGEKIAIYGDYDADGMTSVIQPQPIVDDRHEQRPAVVRDQLSRQAWFSRGSIPLVILTPRVSVSRMCDSSRIRLADSVS